MRVGMRSAAVIAVAATMFLVGMIVASAGSGRVGGGSTGPSTTGPSGQAAPQAVPLVTNTDPVATFVPQPQGETFVPITPCRIVDTRAAGGKIAAGGTRSFHVRGSTGFAAQGGNSTGCGIPASAAAISASLTASQPDGAGYLRAWPNGQSAPNTTMLNYPAAGVGDTTGATILLGGGSFDITVGIFDHAAQVIIDVTGYYEPQMHLIILADGTVWYGNATHLTEVIHTTGTGSYSLVFDRSLAGCNVLTTSNDQRDVQAIGSWGGTTLTVSTSHESAGVFTQTDESFQVFVIC